MSKSYNHLMGCIVRAIIIVQLWASCLMAHSLPWENFHWALDDDERCGELSAQEGRLSCENFYVLGFSGSSLAVLKKIIKPECRCLPFYFMLMGPDEHSSLIIDLSSDQFRDQALDSILSSLLKKHEVTFNLNVPFHSWELAAKDRRTLWSKNKLIEGRIEGAYLDPYKRHWIVVSRQWKKSDEGMENVISFTSVAFGHGSEPR